MSGIATAIVGTTVVGGLISNNAQKNAAKDAARAQGDAVDASVEEQRRQYDNFQKILKPYMSAGGTALTQQLNFLGLNGQEKQQESFDQILNFPMYNQFFKNGEDAILQNASATGGLRGGDTQGALAMYRPQVIQQMLEDRYNKLNNITTLGQNSAAGVGTAGQNTANSISTALMAGGDANAQAALMRGQANANFASDVAGSIGLVAGKSKGTFGSF